MLYELAAEAGRVDIIRLLLELGANPNVDQVDGGSDTDDTPPADEVEDQESSSHSPKYADLDETEGDNKRDANVEIEASGGGNDVSTSDAGSSQDQDEVDDASEDVVMSDSDDFERTPMLTLHPPLTGAAFSGQLESVKVLLDEVKVSIDEQDENATSIAYAASAGHADVVTFLLSRGASIVTKPDSADILALALKDGNMTAVNAILESEQWKASGREVTIDHLGFAGHGANEQAVELILSLCKLPPPTGNISDLTDELRENIIATILQATTKASLACLQRLLPYVTCRQPDGSYAYFEGPEHFEITFFISTEDAIDISDDPDLFKLAWTTVLRRPNTSPQDLMARTPFDN